MEQEGGHLVLDKGFWVATADASWMFISSVGSYKNYKPGDIAKQKLK